MKRLIIIVLTMVIMGHLLSGCTSGKESLPWDPNIIILCEQLGN